MAKRSQHSKEGSALEKETMGTVASVSKQWWLKVNTKPFRTGPLDGAELPHFIKVTYRVNGNDYTKRKWIGAGLPVPMKGAGIKVVYDEDKPSKAKIID